MLQTSIIYRTRAIISRGLSTFYPIFHCGLYCRAVSITDNLCTKKGNSSIFGPKIHELERILFLEYIFRTLGILLVLKDQTNLFYLIFSGGAALPESPVQLFKSRNAWSRCWSHSKFVSLLLAAQYRYKSGGPEGKRFTDTGRTITYGSWQSSLCCGDCAEKFGHWSAK